MSDDEIKVNSENTPRKNLATLGQVKDALDKRDKKIDSLKEDLANAENDFSNVLIKGDFSSVKNYADGNLYKICKVGGPS